LVFFILDKNGEGWPFHNGFDMRALQQNKNFATAYCMELNTKFIKMVNFF
jgi:hypothetical protein